MYRSSRPLILCVFSVLLMTSLFTLTACAPLPEEAASQTDSMPTAAPTLTYSPTTVPTMIPTSVPIIEVAPLGPITIQNVTQLEKWIPIDQNSQQAQEWIPVARGTLGGISYSPTDNLIAVGSSTGLYLLDTNNLHQEPVHVAGIDESAWGVFSSDGTKIALQTSSQQLYIYSLSTQNVVQLTNIPTTDRFSGIQFGDDSTSVFAAAYGNGNNYSIVKWDAETGEHLSTLEMPEITQYINDNQPRSLTVPFLVEKDRYITYHPFVVSFSNATTVVQIWESDTHDELLRLDLPVDVSYFYYSAEQNIFVTSGYTNNYNGAVVWNASTGGRIATVSPPGGPLLSDGSVIWFYDGDTSVIRAWDIESRQFTHEYDFETGQRPSNVSNNRLISSDTFGTISVWQIDNATLTKLDSVQAFTGATRDLLFTSNGDELIVVLVRAGVQVWDTESWATENFIAVKEYIRALAISPDNQSIAAAIGDYAPGEKLRFYNMVTGKIIASATYPQTIDSLAYHPAGDYVAAGRSGRFDVALYSASTAAELSRFGEGGTPYSVAFSPDGTLLASGNADMNVRVYNLATRQSEYVLEAGGTVHSVEFSHDGTVLAVGTGKLTLCDAGTGSQLHVSDYLGAEISDMAFSPDDSLLATVSSNSLALWDVSSGRLLWEQEINSSYSPHVAFHPDGTLIAVNLSGITLWVVNTGTDSDNDGVDDVRDACPIQAGDVNGCPSPGSEH